MSRSYRKTPFVPNLRRRSQDRWKRAYNRTFRRASKHNLRKAFLNDHENYYYEELYKLHYANMCLSPSDGRYYYPLFSEDKFLNDYWLFRHYSSYTEYKKHYLLHVLGK